MKLFQLTYQHSTLGKRISFHPSKKAMWKYYASAKEVARETGLGIGSSAFEEINLPSSAQGIANFLNQKILEIQKVAREWR